jgi:hypothetical protein
MSHQSSKPSSSPQGWRMSTAQAIGFVMTVVAMLALALMLG